MKSMNLSENHSQDDEERHPRGNPLLVILVAVVCAAFIFVITTGVAKADPSLQAESSKTDTAKSTWKPPVAKIPVIPSPVDKVRAEEIAQKWGIELLSLRLSAAGYMIDFRFRVLDVEKANTFFDHRIKPHLVVEKSNAKLPIPMAAKVGAFRATNRGKNIKPNKIYYMVFGNPDAHVKPGEKVTMVIGDFREDHLTVN